MHGLTRLLSAGARSRITYSVRRTVRALGTVTDTQETVFSSQSESHTSIASSCLFWYNCMVSVHVLMYVPCI